MAQQFINIESFLKDKGFKLITSINEFYETKTIEFECSKQHLTKIKNTSFMNKKIKFKDFPEKLCSTCLYYDTEGERFKTEYEKISKKNGHILISIEKNRKIIYKCGNCGSENQSFLHNITNRSIGTCPFCQNEKFKKNIEDVKNEIEKICLDHTLVSYTNCKDLLMKCPKNHTYKISLNLFKTGRRCPVCAPENRIKTNIEKYGVDNPSKCNEIKQKIIKTTTEKFGVPYAIQNVDVFKKQLSKCYSKKDFIFPSGSVEKIRGYEDWCIKELLKIYKEENIIVDPKKIPVISYYKVGNEEKKTSRYFPDVLLPDKVIEVKSIYTYEKDKENNERKFKACSEAGYDLEVWIYNRKGEIVEKKFYNKECECIPKLAN